MGPYERAAPLGLRMQADRVEKGDAALPEGREGQAITQIIAERQAKGGAGIPVQLSAAGQQKLAAIDPVLEEITRTRAMLKAAMDKGLTQGDLAKDWALYKLHQDSPNTKLISNLSFSSLRSAVSALAGGGSRSWNALSLALEHTPSALGSPKRSLELMDEMEQRVKEARRYAIEDEKKSGVVSTQPGGVPPVVPGAHPDPLGIR